MNTPIRHRLSSPHRNLLIDIGLAIALTTPGLVLACAGAECPSITIPAVVIAGAIVIWRRRAPFAVLLAVSALASAGEPAYFTSTACLALFEVGARFPLGRALLGYLLAVGLPLVGTTVKILLGYDFAATADAVPPVGLGTSIVEPYMVLALTAGVVLQTTQQRKRAQKESLEHKLEHARALERARITAEMHDVVGHALTVMVSLANGARLASISDPDGSRAALERLSAVGASAVDEMQRTFRVLRDADGVLDDALHSSGYDLPPLEETINVFKEAGLPVRFTQSGGAMPEDAQLLTAVHRIIQEGMTNALRYATDATLVDVAVTIKAGLVTIDITDDGRSTGRSTSVGTERGLIGIAERAAAFGGLSTAGPRNPYGWETRAVLRLKGAT